MTTLVRNDLRAAAATAAKNMRLALGFGAERLHRDVLGLAGVPRDVGGWRRLRNAYSALLLLPFCGCTFLDTGPPAPAVVADYASQSATLVVSDFNAEGKVYTRR